MRTRAIVHSALFASREPPRFRHGLIGLREDAATGYTTKDARAASFLIVQDYHPRLPADGCGLRPTPTVSVSFGIFLG